MECNEIKNLLSNYLENDISDQQKAQVEEHLYICKDCVRQLNTLKRMVWELGNLKKVAAPEDLLEGIQRRLGEQPKKREFLRRIKLPLEAAGVLTSIILVVYIVNQSGILKTERQIKLMPAQEKEEPAKTDMDSYSPSGTSKTKEIYEGVLPYNAISSGAPVKEALSGKYNILEESSTKDKRMPERKITLVTTKVSENISKVKAIVKELNGEIEKEGPKNISVRIPAKNLSILITRLGNIAKVTPTIPVPQEEITRINIELIENQQ